jgi:hypothetical protein
MFTNIPMNLMNNQQRAKTSEMKHRVGRRGNALNRDIDIKVDDLSQ